MASYVRFWHEADQVAGFLLRQLLTHSRHAARRPRITFLRENFLEPDRRLRTASGLHPVSTR
jgi:hypothetical protein